MPRKMTSLRSSKVRSLVLSIRHESFNMLTVPAEPIPPQASNNPSSGHKSTTEKIKEKVKKPFASEDEVRSPELEAAVEVIEKKGMAAN